MPARNEYPAGGFLKRAIVLRGASPDSLLGISPEGDLLVDFKGLGAVCGPDASFQGAVLHLGQEVLGKRASHVVAAPILATGKGEGLGVIFGSERQL